MTDHPDAHDAQLDRNLRRWAKRLPLPAAPSARQRAVWKTPPAVAAGGEASPAAPQPRKGVIRMFPARFWAITGSAVAAAALAAALVLNPSGSSRADAAMILQSFRDSVHRGLRLDIRDIHVEGLLINGRVQLDFTEPLNIGALLCEDQDFDMPEPAAVFVDATILADAEAADLAGLDAQVTAALSQYEQWAYARVERLPDEIVDGLPPPIAYFATNLLRNGVFVDIASLDALDYQDNDSQGETHGAGVTGRISFGVHDGSAGQASAPVASTKVDVRISSDELEASHDADFDFSAEGPSHAILESFIRPLLIGAAGRDDIDALIASLNSTNIAAQIEEVEPGFYVLHGGNLNVGSDDPFLANAEVRIAYRENVGVEWFALENLGDRNGSVRVQFANDALDPALLNRSRVIQVGVTTVIDANTIGSFAQLFGGAEE